MALEYWPDDYVAKRMTAAEAVSLLRPGQRVFIGTSCGEPQSLVRELAGQSTGFADLEVVRLLSLEALPLSLIAEKADCRRQQKAFKVVSKRHWSCNGH